MMISRADGHLTMSLGKEETTGGGEREDQARAVCLDSRVEEGRRKMWKFDQITPF